MFFENKDMKASTVLKGLLKVKEMALSDEKSNWFNIRHGICANIDNYESIYKKVDRKSTRYYMSSYLTVFYKQWPEWSGCTTFPVPSTDSEYTEEEMYMEFRGSMWIREYGAARLRLLDYLIQRVEALGDSEISFGEE